MYSSHRAVLAGSGFHLQDILAEQASCGRGLPSLVTGGLMANTTAAPNFRVSAMILTHGQTLVLECPQEQGLEPEYFNSSLLPALALGLNQSLVNVCWTSK